MNVRGVLKELGEVRTVKASAIARVARQGLSNPKILLGVLLETIFFGFLLVLLKRNDVSLIWPLTRIDAFPVPVMSPLTTTIPFPLMIRGEVELIWTELR